jgi:hypothetical protein
MSGREAVRRLGKLLNVDGVSNYPTAKILELVEIVDEFDTSK